MTIRELASGIRFDAALVEDDAGALWLCVHEPQPTGATGTYALEDLLRTGWVIASASLQEQALLDAHEVPRTT